PAAPPGGGAGSGGVGPAGVHRRQLPLRCLGPGSWAGPGMAKAIPDRRTRCPRHPGRQQRRPGRCGPVPARSHRENRAVLGRNLLDEKRGKALATRRRTTRVLLVPAVLALALVLTACGSNWEQVLRPPRADVTGIQVVAVFPFASWTVDPGLARSITDRVYRALRDSGWYEVIPPEQVESVLVQRGVDPRSVVGGQLAAEVA